MTKKLFLTLVSVVFLVFMLAGCGDKKDDTTDTGDTAADADNTDTGDTGTVSDEDTTDTGDADDSDVSDPAVWEAKYKKADESAEKVAEDIVKANNRLGMEIFSRLAKEEGAKNVMISPLSIAISMAMTANGAVDGALSEMKEVLGFSGMEMPDVNEQFAQLIASLVEADKDMVLEIADSIWMDDAFAPNVKADFISVLEDFYSAALFTEDFADAATVGKINSWVSEKTHGKIDRIIDQIGVNTVMYIINAVYFKAAWTNAFDKDLTFKGNFWLSDNGMKDVDYMCAGGDSYSFKIDKENKYSVVRIPYGRGVFAFYSIVPSGNVDELIGKILETGIDSYLETPIKRQDFSLDLPKFKFAYEQSLKETFRTLGMGQVFSGGLDNISSDVENLYVGEVFHKTFIEVNEEGTEAAAVTEVAADTGDTGGDEYIISARRPFVFVIRDERTGSILFIGKVEDPTAE
ncbi:serpin family protein [bacterium]|nr:serpin family protein [bacterium]